jgi:hypothetical protein
MTSRLSLAQVVPALDQYDGKYNIFEAFADDIDELHQLRVGEPLEPALDTSAQGKHLFFTVDGRRYQLELTETSAIAKITRALDHRSPREDGKRLGALAGTAIGHAVSEKGEGWTPGLFLGLLAGSSQEQHKERTVTVQYNPQAREWRAYGGPMSQWLRQRVAAAS